jgi:TonB family protein
MTKLNAILAAACFSLPAFAQELVPPRPIDTPAAVAPPGATGGAIVGLAVTVGVDGTVQDAVVDVSGGPGFDAAALEAVKKWKFRPALRDGVPFAARVRIPFRFVPEGAPPPAPGLLGTVPPQAGSPDAGVLPPQAGAIDAGAPSAAAVTAAPDAGTSVPAPPEPEESGAIGEVSVRGRQRKVDRGGSDFQIDIGQLSIIPRQNAEELLKLAPGIFLTNEGGEGHAEEVFLRGYSSVGQAIEFSVNGVPINEIDNPDAHGYADTHFLIPEVIKDLQVTEGPFDPHQGDFAVAGSARYELGVRERGLRIEGTVGSFGRRRYLALWAPKGQRENTFAAFDFSTTDGFGVNRAASRASAIGEFEGELGQRGLYRILAMAYSTHYNSAGIVRRDDVDSGRLGFYGTEDPSQGGDAQRYTLSLDVESPAGDGVATQQIFLTARTLRITENFTGFLLDTQQFGQTIHPQRGDAVEKDYSALTAGGRGAYRVKFMLAGMEQAIEAGYFARYDHTVPVVKRLRFGTQIPYLIDQDIQTDVFNLAGYLDVDLKLGSRLTVRGGLRDDYFHYNVIDFCQTSGNYAIGLPLNVNCPFYDRGGSREPSRRQTATGALLAPKVTALFALPWGLTLTASAGQGGNSLDARYISQNELSPIIKLKAAEAGVIYRRRLDEVDLTARAVGYYTHADQELTPDLNQGRFSASPGTTRVGAVGAVRATGRFFDEAASVTTTNPRYDDTHSLVPYVPLVIARSDTALFGPIPGNWRLFGQRLLGEAGLAIEYVGKRSLPFSQFSSPTLQIDGSLGLRVGPVKASVRAINLTNQQIYLSQFFYTSDFRSRSYPTLAPAAHFTAAPPRILLFTLEIDLEREH